MKIILSEDIKGIGQKGQLVDVNDGYGRNFILKNKKGILATTGSIKTNDAIQEKIKEKIENEKAAALRIKEEIDNKTVKTTVKSGSQGKLFGALTTKDLSDIVKEQLGHDFNKKKIELKDTIKLCGTYDFKIKIYPKITAALKIEVIGSDE